MHNVMFTTVDSGVTFSMRNLTFSPRIVRMHPKFWQVLLGYDDTDAQKRVGYHSNHYHFQSIEVLCLCVILSKSTFFYIAILTIEPGPLYTVGNL